MAKSEAAMLKEERERMSNDLATKGQELKNAMKDKMNSGEDGEDLTKEAVYTEHQMSVEECAELLGTKCSEQEKGLSSSERQSRLKQHGPNALTPPAQKSEIVKFLEKLFDFFACLLWFGAILCFISYGLQRQVDNLILGIVLASVVTITAIFSYLQDAKASDLMAKFANMVPTETVVYQDGEKTKCNAEELVVGDVIFVKFGDRVPADIRVTQATEDMRVDHSSLTGEPDPIPRQVNKTHDSPLETKNLAFFGTLCPRGSCEGIVIRTGDRTAMGKIAALTTQTEQKPTPINLEIEHFVHIVSGVAFFLGISFFIIGMILGIPILDNLVFMIGIIVANVPEGLLATVTICLTLTAQNMAEKMVLVKNMESVETLGSTTAICSDKTGTLTQNKMTVREVVYQSKIWGCETIKDIDDDAGEYNKENVNFRRVVRCATVCNSATFQPARDPKTGIKTPFKKIRTLGDGKTQLNEIQWLTNGDATESAMIKFTQNKDFFSTVIKEAAQKNKGAELERLKANIGELEAKLKGATEAEADEIQKRLDNAKAMLADREVADLGGIMDTRNAYPKVSKGKKKWEIPFNSANKFQVSVHHDVENADSPLLLMKGAPDRLIARCDRIYNNKDGSAEPMTPEARAKLLKLNSTLAKKGRRVLALCESPLDPKKYPIDFDFQIEPSPNFPLGTPKDQFDAKVAQFEKDLKAERVEEKDRPHENETEGLVFIGLMALIDPPRPGVKEAVDKCKNAGIKVVMVTGDHPETAKAIASEVHIIQEGAETEEDIMDANEAAGVVKGDKGYRNPMAANAIVIPGHTFNDETPQAWWDDVIYNHDNIVFARTSPTQKLIIVSNFQKRKHIVAVTGDGVNDAPALRRADIGVAMGIAGSDVSKDAADMILIDDNFASIVNGVEQGRLIFDNLKKSIAYTLSSNIPEISPFLAYITIGIPLALSTVLILCVDLGTDMVPAISMAWENKEADIMRRKPRDASTDRLVTRKLISFAYLQIGVIQCIAGFFTYLTVLNDYGYPPHILPGSARYNMWGTQTMMCQLNGGIWRNEDGFAYTQTTKGTVGLDTAGTVTTNHIHTAKMAQQAGYMFWDPYASPTEIAAGFTAGTVVSCSFPPKNFMGTGSYTGTGGTGSMQFTSEFVGSGLFAPQNGVTAEVSSNFGGAQGYTGTSANGAVVTVQGKAAMHAKGYIEYLPFKSRLSVFYDTRYLAYQVDDSTLAGKIPGADSFTPTVYYSSEPFSGIVIPRDAVASADSNVLSSTTAGLVQASLSLVKFPTSNNSVLSGTGLGTSVFTASTYESLVYPSVDYNNNATWDTAFVGTGDKGVPITTVPTNDGVNLVPRMSSFMDGGKLAANVMSRQLQKEALHHAQCAVFISIIVVQWADLMICKTRWLSIITQGMKNPAMNFGLVFETILGSCLCYTPGLNASSLGTRPLRFTHWLPGVPFMAFIFGYDELRKYIMRTTSHEFVDKNGGVTHTAGWLEMCTYY